MKYKPDWSEARERLAALWAGRFLDRPCVAVTAPSGCGLVAPPPPPANPEDKWLGPDWVLADLRARLENTWWGGEAVPSHLLMGGWTVCLGGRPRFDLATIWFEPFAVDFDRPPPFRNAPDDPWWEKHARLYGRVAAFAGRDDFLLGQPCLLPANDLIALHMGTEAFLVALLDHPRWMRDAITAGARDLLAAHRRLADRVKERHEFWYGNAGWMPFWAPEPYLATQSDVSCLLSPELFDEFVVPELEIYGRAFGRLWYHLDGGDARQHLPRLLTLPYVRVVQYTPRPSEPPNGPAHLDFYRRVQAAGRILHLALPPQNVEPLIRALDPGLLMLDTSCGSPDEGRDLLAAVRRWTRR
jgi:hypothetical protein